MCWVWCRAYVQHRIASAAWKAQLHLQFTTAVHWQLRSVSLVWVTAYLSRAAAAAASDLQVSYKPDLIHGGFMLDHTTRTEVLAAVQTMAATAAVCAVTATAAGGAAGAAAAAVTAAAGLASNDSSSRSSSETAEQRPQPDLMQHSFCSRLPSVPEWDVTNIHSSLSASGASITRGRRCSKVGDQTSKQLRAGLAKCCARLGLEADVRGFVSTNSSTSSSSSSSSSTKCLCSEAAAAEDATGVAAAAAAATVAAAAATAAHTALIAAAARPAGLLSTYCADVAEWQQQQQQQSIAVERRSTVH
jgi:hypothetical protein